MRGWLELVFRDEVLGEKSVEALQPRRHGLCVRRGGGVQIAYSQIRAQACVLHHQKFYWVADWRRWHSPEGAVENVANVKMLPIPNTNWE